MFDGNVSNLIASLKRRASVPTRQKLFDEQDFLEFLTEEIHTEMVPTIVRAREDFYLTFRDFQIVPLTPTSVPGFGNEPFGLLPFGGSVPITWGQLLNRSIGTRIKDVYWTNGAEGKIIGHIPRITLDDVSQWAGMTGYYFQDNDIIFFPESNYNGQFIRVYFYRIPNRLTLAQNCARVQFTNQADLSITVDAIPDASWTTGFQLDIIQAYAGFQSISDSITITNITGNVLEVDRLSQRINAGDWVCPAGYACVAQVPEIAYPLVAQLGSIKFLEAFGRVAESEKAEKKYDKMHDQFKNMIQPRSELSKKKIVSRRGIWTY